MSLGYPSIFNFPFKRSLIFWKELYICRKGAKTVLGVSLYLQPRFPHQYLQRAWCTGHANSRHGCRVLATRPLCVDFTFPHYSSVSQFQCPVQVTRLHSLFTSPWSPRFSWSWRFEGVLSRYSVGFSKSVFTCCLAVNMQFNSFCLFQLCCLPIIPETFLCHYPHC